MFLMWMRPVGMIMEGGRGGGKDAVVVVSYLYGEM